MLNLFVHHKSYNYNIKQYKTIKLFIVSTVNMNESFYSNDLTQSHVCTVFMYLFIYLCLTFIYSFIYFYMYLFLYFYISTSHSVFALSLLAHFKEYLNKINTVRICLLLCLSRCFRFLDRSYGFLTVWNCSGPCQKPNSGAIFRISKQILTHRRSNRRALAALATCHWAENDLPFCDWLILPVCFAS